MKYVSLNVIVSVIFIAYMINIVKNFVDMFIPPTCKHTEMDKCFKSYLVNNPHQDLYVYSSVKRHPSGLDVSKVFILEDFDYKNSFQKVVELKIPQSTRNNGTLYLFLASTASYKRKWSWDELASKAVVEKIPLITFTTRQAAAFNLLNSEPSENVSNEKTKERPIGHLRSSISFSILSDPIEFPYKEIPGELANYIRFTTNREYLPILQYNFLKTRMEHLIEVKKDSFSMNLTLDYAPASIGKMKILVHFGMSLKTLSQMGFNEKNIDEVKGIFADTNLYLLCATLIISSFHLLLDFLAFKNDISFWRGKKSMAGLSGRTVLWRAFSQVIILLFLIDENTSLLILVPSGIGTLIEFWKVKKMWHVTLDWKDRKLPRLVFATHEINQAEMKTRAVDAEAMKYLTYLLYPICIFGAIYSLLYLPHKSWYSWCLHSIVNGVYAFGFLFMLPQLFINYKLKSVAALPWRAFMYKAFNTFIDDIFAFIITMPVAHRVACFRDDVVFLIYLYQRWLYPVDKSRVDDSHSIDETVDQTHEKKE